MTLRTLTLWTAAATLLAGVGLAARADEIELRSGDRLTGTLAGPDEVALVVLDLPEGAQVRVTLDRTGPGDLQPVLRLLAPNGSDETPLLATAPARKGARLAASLDEVPTGGPWRLEIGSAQGGGDYRLSLRVKQLGRHDAALDVPPGGVATAAFGALAGSRAKVTAVHTDGPAAPVLDALRGPEGAVDLADARTRVRGRRTKVTTEPLGATGEHELAFGLAGGAAGRVDLRVSLVDPRPRRARLVHPGAEPSSVLRLVTASLADATVGESYDVLLAASGGTPPYAFSVASGAPPDGIVLLADGRLAGTPETGGEATFSVRVADSAVPAAQAVREFRIDVAAPGGAPEWRELVASGAAPAGRSSAGFVYDPVNGRVVVALGSTGSAGFPPVYADTAALALGDSPSWTALGGGPRARWGPSLVLDTARSRALLYGGNVDGFQTNGEVWALDLSTPSGGWTQLAPTGPAPAARLSHVAVYDPANDRMVVFGGGSGTVPGNASRADVWELSFAAAADGAWSERTPAAGPGAREFSAGVHDPATGRLVIFGGMTSGAQFGDTWALDLATPGQESWTELTPGGTSPAARDEHTAVLDSVHHRMVVFGGRVGQTDTAEAWALDLAAGGEAWSLLAPSGTPPAARDSHAAVYDPVGRRMIVFSGFTGFPSTPFQDLWELRLP